MVHPNCESLKGEARPVTAQEMIDGYKQLIQEAHDRGIEVYPFHPNCLEGLHQKCAGRRYRCGMDA